MMEQQENQEQPRPAWGKRVGEFFAWSGGFAGTAVIAALLILLIADLFSAKRLFTFRGASDATFWAASLVLLAGLLAPSSSDLESLNRRPGQSKSPADSQPYQGGGGWLTRMDERAARLRQRRIQRVYNPWRWRLWFASLLTMGISVLLGLPSM